MNKNKKEQNRANHHTVQMKSKKGLVQLVKVQLLKTRLVDTFRDETARIKLVNTKSVTALIQNNWIWAVLFLRLGEQLLVLQQITIGQITTAQHVQQ